ncbi:cupin [Candidatus Daviesbacteria bacterium]|nr:cupin [Candidatus Daviesbacteria bacterium]
MKTKKDLKTVDRSEFTNTPYVKRVEKPWGYELHFVKEDMPYMGKIMHINAGKRLSLQIHDQKLETYFLASGECNLLVEDKDGGMITVSLEKGKGYTVLPGQKHRHQAVTGCDVVEVSTPEIGNTYRLEDDYSRPTETPGLREDPNRGWNG